MLASIALLGATALFYLTELEWISVWRAVESLPAVPLLLLAIVLPPFGFSIGVVYLLIGARFGPWVGGAFIAAVTATHVLSMHWIGRSFLRALLERWLARREHRLPTVPAGEQASLVVMTVLAPGLPYFARNYLLAIAGVPLGTCLAVGVPLYVVRSYTTLFLGDIARAPDGGKFVLLVAVYVLKLGVCAYVIWRIRRRLRTGGAGVREGAR